jgi:hypothetical protein
VTPLFLETDFDGERLARVREELARGLRMRGAPLLESEEPAALESFLLALDRDAAALVSAGWPVVRIVQGLTSESDPAVAVPALRYLGVRGDRAALRAVGTALARPELERAACLALIDAGSGGLAELDRAFWDPDLSPLVVNALAAITSFAPLDAYTFMDRLLDRTRFERGSEPLRRLAAPLPALIARVDVPDHLAARTLLELATHPLLDRAAVLDAFARAPGADRLLVEATGSARDSEREALLLEAVARVAPAECFDWVARRARSPRLEGLAFAALAAYPGEEAVCTLLELRPSSRRGDEASYLAAWRKALEIDSTRAVAVARNPYIVADPPSGRRLLEVLVASQSKAAVPALIALGDI